MICIFNRHDYEFIFHEFSWQKFAAALDFFSFFLFLRQISLNFSAKVSVFISIFLGYYFYSSASISCENSFYGFDFLKFCLLCLILLGCCCSLVFYFCFKHVVLAAFFTLTTGWFLSRNVRGLLLKIVSSSCKIFWTGILHKIILFA